MPGMLVLTMSQGPAPFRKYYLRDAGTLGSKLPTLKASRYPSDGEATGPEQAPYFCIFESRVRERGSC